MEYVASLKIDQTSHIRKKNNPEIGSMKMHIPMTYFVDERQGYDIQNFIKKRKLLGMYYNNIKVFYHVH